DITVNLDGWDDTSASLKHFRMDEEHSNAFGVWKAMGKPQNPAGEDYARLEASGKLAEIEGEATAKVDDGKITLKVSLP
ncbi:beta-xylosidase, partial [Rhizobium ruizarguesonis]